MVIDTVDMAEKFLRDRILRIHHMDSLESVPSGRGWHYLRESFEQFLSELDKVVSHGVHVLVVGHSTVKRYQPPMAESAFDRFQLKLYETNCNRLMEWADAVLFLNWDTRVSESRNGKPRGVGGRVRVIHTQDSAGDAKVRVDLPEKLPCEFDALLLFGQEQEEVRQKAAAASGSANPDAQDTAPPPPPLNADLRDQLLSAIGDLENELVCRYLSGHNRIPAGGSIDDLRDTQARWIIDHVADFRARVEKVASEPF